MGQTFTGMVATFTDANPNATVGDFMTAQGKITVNWGDGTAADTSATVTANGPGSFGIAGTHVFATAGPFTGLVQIADAGGAVAQAQFFVQVQAPLPQSNSQLILSLPELRDIVLARLKDAEKYLPQIKVIEDRINKDFANLKGTDDPALRAKLVRLNDTLVSTQPILTALDRLGNKNSYLPAFADKIVTAVNRVKEQYAAALVIAYSDKDPDNRILAAAGQDMAALPTLITGLYLSKDGLPKLIKDLNIMLLNLDQLRALTKDASRPADDFFFVPKSQGGIIGLFQKALAAVERLYQQKDPNAFAQMLVLTTNIQNVITVVGALLWYQQFVYWDQQLTGPSEAHTLAGQYRGKFDAILKLFEKAHKDKDPALFNQAVKQLQALLEDPKFDKARTTITERLKTEEQVKDFVKQVLIVAVSAALTRGAGGLVSGGLKGVLTAEEISGIVLLTEALAFTSFTRFGQQLVFGEAPGTFLQDLGWNALMFGSLRLGEKAFTSIVTRIAGNPENFQTLGKLLTGLGRFGTAVLTLQGLNELLTALKEGRSQIWWGTAPNTARKGSG